MLTLLVRRMPVSRFIVLLALMSSIERSIVLVLRWVSICTCKGKAGKETVEIAAGDSAFAETGGDYRQRAQARWRDRSEAD